MSIEVHVNTDSSIAKSIASRRGAGRVRQIEVRELLIQDPAAKGELSVKKVKGESEVADILTKRVDRNSLKPVREGHWSCEEERSS